MKTQKGLKETDVIVIVSEDTGNSTNVTFSVAFPDCEKFTVSKDYVGSDNLNKRIDEDLEEFIDNLSSTVFTVEADEDEEVVNDSWGAIMGDIFKGAKKKFDAVKS